MDEILRLPDFDVVVGMPHGRKFPFKSFWSDILGVTV
jgi:hypothetical protein